MTHNMTQSRSCCQLHCRAEAATKKQNQALCACPCHRLTCLDAASTPTGSVQRPSSAGKQWAQRSQRAVRGRTTETTHPTNHCCARALVLRQQQYIDAQQLLCHASSLRHALLPMLGWLPCCPQPSLPPPHSATTTSLPRLCSHVCSHSHPP
jgi:hypothetical protein